MPRVARSFNYKFLNMARQCSQLSFSKFISRLARKNCRAEREGPKVAGTQKPEGNHLVNG
jgi:hypothetical protein